MQVLMIIGMFKPFSFFKIGLKTTFFIVFQTIEAWLYGSGGVKANYTLECREFLSPNAINMTTYGL